MNNSKKELEVCKKELLAEIEERTFTAVIRSLEGVLPKIIEQSIYVNKHTGVGSVFISGFTLAIDLVKNMTSLTKEKLGANYTPLLPPQTVQNIVTSETGFQVSRNVAKSIHSLLSEQLTSVLSEAREEGRSNLDISVFVEGYKLAMALIYEFANSVTQN